MELDESSVGAVQAASKYFDHVKSDLLIYGGILESRSKSFQSQRDFAVCIFDQLAVILARKYHAGEIDFETADSLANAIEGELIDLITYHWSSGYSDVYPEKWQLVYQAFDAGEWDHFGRSNDPVAEFTDPQITKFLAKYE